MRQLFLPACLCVLTWSGATSSDHGVAFDDYSRGTLAAKTQLSSTAAPVRSASLETTGLGVRDAETPRGRTSDIAIPRDETSSAVVAIPQDQKQDNQRTPTATDIAALVPDLDAEFPVPSGVVINNGIPEGIPLPPVYKPVVHRSEDEVCGTLTEAAQRNNLPAPFFIRLLFQESRFKPEAVSAVGAQGVAQFMPQTAAQMGLDNPFDPLQAIPASARLLSDLVRQFGNLGLAAAAYNAGPKRVADWLAAKGKSKLPEETQGYVKTITGKPVETWSLASAKHPGQKLPKQAPCQEAAGLLAYNGPEAVPVPSPSPLRAVAKNNDKNNDKSADKSADKLKVAEAKPTEKPAEKTAGKSVGKPATKDETVEKTAAKAKSSTVAELSPRKRNPKNLLTPKRQKVASR